jgi:hypothetical protein
MSPSSNAVQPLKVVFCTTCKGRVSHIKKTLPKNLADNPGATFILLDYNDSGELAYHVRNACQSEIKEGRLVYYQYRDNVPFRMAHAKNMAHRLGIMEGADILVNLDADNRTGEGFAEYIAENFTRTRNDPQEIFMWSRMIKGVLKRGITGRIVVSKNAFLLAGGYDEQYATYSPDDKDFEARLRRLGFCAQEIDSKYLDAVYHDDNVRFKEYAHLLETSAAYETPCISPHNRVVNNGKFGCGVVYKNFDETPITLAPVPTRIFGIGMHKTATTSLSEALTILGLKSGHWEHPRWARQVWSDMKNVGSSPSVEKYYALSDLPIGILFRELDVAYPGSKFILTVRDEYEWLKSVEKHFDRNINPYRNSWDNDAFTHRLHNEIYGQRKFSYRVFVERYRKHNAEVLEYFKDRPNDLLVMNVDDKTGWTELCAFLGQPVPSMSYPRKFVTKK